MTALGVIETNEDPLFKTAIGRAPRPGRHYYQTQPGRFDDLRRCAQNSLYHDVIERGDGDEKVYGRQSCANADHHTPQLTIGDQIFAQGG